MAMIMLSAAVLAGGESKRMGENKAFLRLDGRYLIELIIEKLCRLFTEVMVVTDMVREMDFLPVHLVEDVYHEGEKNALRGIHAALTATSQQSCFILACDMPFLSPALIKHMSSFAEDYDLIVPRLDGHYQPLFSFYHKKCLPFIHRALEQKYYKISSLYDNFNVKVIDEITVQIYDPKRLSFCNINNRDDFRCAERLLKVTG
ncbi:MAG TPA: molybdenum cofactor guanylyltransferase [Firmicutes bacterium]|nr:molybdenum cofactor guanylyltransferase [Bacillota bacterium]